MIQKEALKNANPYCDKEILSGVTIDSGDNAVDECLSALHDMMKDDILNMRHSPSCGPDSVRRLERLDTYYKVVCWIKNYKAKGK